MDNLTEYQLSERDWLTIACSRRYSTGKFFQRTTEKNSSRELSCNSVCDSVSSHPQGGRAYRSEVHRASTGTLNSWLTDTPVGHLLNNGLFNHPKYRVNETKNRWLNASGKVIVRPDQATDEFVLRCTCGPGQSQDGKMIFRELRNWEHE